MNKIRLVLRGHIRNGLDDDRLYMFVKKLTDIYDLEIYIHTWNKVQNSLSYRHIEEINIEVTEQRLIDYFKEIPITKIIIDDDSKIKLIGNLQGKILASNIPTIGWKNMWYGKAAIINAIPDDGYIINTRFDYFKLQPILIENEEALLKTIDINEDKINFAKKGPYAGVDNFYCGSLYNIRELINRFNNNLDSILKSKYIGVDKPEKIVFLESNYSSFNNFSMGPYRPVTFPTLKAFFGRPKK